MIDNKEGMIRMRIRKLNTPNRNQINTTDILMPVAAELGIGRRLQFCGLQPFQFRVAVCVSVAVGFYGVELLAPRPTLLLSHPGLGPAMAEVKCFIRY